MTMMLRIMMSLILVHVSALQYLVLRENIEKFNHNYNTPISIPEIFYGKVETCVKL
jgi:hypothetical protein